MDVFSGDDILQTPPVEQIMLTVYDRKIKPEGARQLDDVRIINSHRHSIDNFSRSNLGFCFIMPDHFFPPINRNIFR